MREERNLEEYKRHNLVAGYVRGMYQGKAWKDGKAIVELQGDSTEDVLKQLKAEVDRVVVEAAAARSTAPTAAEYMDAFRKLLKSQPESRVLMLKAHYRAKERNITAAQLAKAAGFATHTSANLQYGRLGRALYEEMPMELERRADESLIFTSALATPGERTGPEEEWVWKMRPEVAAAMEALALHK